MNSVIELVFSLLQNIWLLPSWAFTVPPDIEATAKKPIVSFIFACMSGFNDLTMLAFCGYWRRLVALFLVNLYVRLRIRAMPVAGREEKIAPCSCELDAFYLTGRPLPEEWFGHHSIKPGAVPFLPVSLGCESVAGQGQQVAKRGHYSLSLAHPQHLPQAGAVSDGENQQGLQLRISGNEPFPPIDPLQPIGHANGIGGGHLWSDRLAA